MGYFKDIYKWPDNIFWNMFVFYDNDKKRWYRKSLIIQKLTMCGAFKYYNLFIYSLFIYTALNKINKYIKNVWFNPYIKYYSY